MSGVLDAVAGILIGLGALVVVVAALGLWTLPDALSRQHAGTKAVTLGLTLLATGAALLVRETGWTVRLGALVVLLFTTVPLASHVLAAAATRESRARPPSAGEADRAAPGRSGGDRRGSA